MKKYLVFVLLIVMISCRKDNEENVMPDINPEDLPEKVFEGDLDNPSMKELQDFYDEQYTVIDGDVILENLDYLTSLNHLINLREIKGKFYIQSIPIENLHGLKNLEKVNYTFKISSIDSENLEGLKKLEFVDRLVLYDLNINNLLAFQSLKSVGGVSLVKLKVENLYGLANLNVDELRMYLSLNKSLKSLEGVKIKQISGNIELIGNPILENIDIFNKIENVKGNLVISGCPMITSLSVFKNLKTVSGNMYLAYLKTNNLKGFEKLERIEGSLGLSFNDVQSFYGLDQLRYIGNSFDIYKNGEIIDLNGLGNLEIVEQSLTIDNNYKMESLSGLNPNISLVKKVSAIGNTALNDYCALNTYIISQNPDYEFEAIHNKYDPLYEDFINGNCSQNK